MAIIFTDSTGLYFYSALLQTNAEIIALIGLYTTFRIQSAHLIIDSLRNYFLLVMKCIVIMHYNLMKKNLEEKYFFLEKLKSKDTKRGSLSAEYQMFRR